MIQAAATHWPSMIYPQIIPCNPSIYPSWVDHRFASVASTLRPSISGVKLLSLRLRLRELLESLEKLLALALLAGGARDREGERERDESGVYLLRGGDSMGLRRRGGDLDLDLDMEELGDRRRRGGDLRGGGERESERDLLLESDERERGLPRGKNRSPRDAGGGEMDLLGGIGLRRGGESSLPPGPRSSLSLGGESSLILLGGASSLAVYGSPPLTGREGDTLLLGGESDLDTETLLLGGEIDLGGEALFLGGDLDLDTETLLLGGDFGLGGEARFRGGDRDLDGEALLLSLAFSISSCLPNQPVPQYRRNEPRTNLLYSALLLNLSFSSHSFFRLSSSTSFLIAISTLCRSLSSLSAILPARSSSVSR